VDDKPALLFPELYPNLAKGVLVLTRFPYLLGRSRDKNIRASTLSIDQQYLLMDPMLISGAVQEAFRKMYRLIIEVKYSRSKKISFGNI